ncbi:ATP-dependent metallopeptidase FtsH/Yme1/Tma family protein [Clostridium oryzae]|uniref:ATP-dependent zinc metalloprotease FtsH n=1 Tax=Clostridium oryzae TaxID=1450648 RepID=A0A1V4IG79_9CLOT|nr:ATP-dependent metallopeptidase FtsH/Yme1/Tma family protein [Clostridium oryzae]OPJ59001.1 ATP-dependent zinc metalloprotease FtsH [Clostridium oryzae]
MKKYIRLKIMLPLILILLSITSLIVFNIYSGKKVSTKNYSSFSEDIKHNRVDKIYLTNSPKMTIKLKDGSTYKTDNPRSSDFKEKMLSMNIQVSENSNSLSLVNTLSFIIISSAFITFILSMKSPSFASNKLKGVDAMELSASTEKKYTFNNVAGNEEAKESVQDIVDFLKNPDKYARYGARMPRGIILYGEPGTGKTLLAKAVAGEASVPFYAMSGSDFVQVYVGVGASRIRNLFKKAKSHGKAVIFIDEIDAIGKKRASSQSNGNDERDQTLNALLTEMSGFNDNSGIVVIAATNRLDVLDSALLRPGRFDRHIEITLPDTSARENILKLHFKNKPIKNIDFKDWSKKTSYFSGAKLESLANEAAIIACKNGDPFITDIHMDTAFSNVIAGYEKKDRSSITDIDKKITAYHESGHALVSMLMLPNESVSKVTIIPSTKGAGGYTLSVPEDRLYQNKSYLEKRIMVLLAGRASEEITFGEDHITTGAYSDLNQATDLALKMISEYGMGNSMGLLSASAVMNFIKPPSDNIINECKDYINDLYAKTKNLLNSNKHILENMSLQLLARETLYTDNLDEILSDTNYKM